jgi:hypothetical protein
MGNILDSVLFFFGVVVFLLAMAFIVDWVADKLS